MSQYLLFLNIWEWEDVSDSKKNACRCTQALCILGTASNSKLNKIILFEAILNIQILKKYLKIL